MPTNRKRREYRRRADVADLTHDQVRDLLTGSAFFAGFGDDEDAMEAAWDVHRDRILARWVAAFPGSRPFAWWLFEGIPEHGERLILDSDSARRWAGSEGARTRGVLHTHLWPPVQEDEATYLDRHNMLSDDERAALAAGDVMTPFSVGRPDLTRELATAS